MENFRTGTGGLWIVNCGLRHGKACRPFFPAPPVWGLDLGQEPGKSEVHFPSENRPSESRKIPEAV